MKTVIFGVKQKNNAARGWYTDSACTKAYNFSKPVTKNLTLFAKWNATSTISGDITPSTPVTASAAERAIISMSERSDLKGSTAYMHTCRTGSVK